MSKEPSHINKLVLGDEDSLEYRGAVLALLQNGYVVHCFRVNVAALQQGRDWERWIYYCWPESLPDLCHLIGQYEESKRNERKPRESNGEETR